MFGLTMFHEGVIWPGGEGWVSGGGDEYCSLKSWEPVGDSAFILTVTIKWHDNHGGNDNT